jgi:hypothetical protein
VTEHFFTDKFFYSLLIAASATLIGVPRNSALFAIDESNVEETLTIDNNILSLISAFMPS